MNITAQSARPNTRANVASSVPLGSGDIAGMRVHPDPSELFRPAACIHLVVEEVGHRLVVELDVHPRAGLLHEPHIFDEQQIVGPA